MQATHNRYSRDLYWSIYDLEDGKISWTGYDDTNWWDNVAPHQRIKEGKKSGKRYEIDFVTGEVTVTAAEKSEPV